MQTSVAVLLGFCVLLAAQGYYFGFVRPTRILAWLNQAGFVFMTFAMIPAPSIVLYLQSGAVERLAKAGITPHPSIEESVGTAVGVGPNPTWVFTVAASSESAAQVAELIHQMM